MYYFTNGYDGSIDESDYNCRWIFSKGIHKQNELLALACGDDGVLLYTCHSDGNFPLVSEIGRINSEYAYNVKIYNLNTIFVATKVGIQIFTIER